MRQDKILVVDDDPDVRMLLQEWLEMEDYQVFVAADGLSGLKEFFRVQPDLVVIDVMMPKMDGLELCRRIREVSTVPVLFLSAKGQEMDKVRGLTFGGDDYITKPVGRAEFIARIEAALRRYRMPGAQEPEPVYSDGVLTIDFAAHEVYARGEKVDLTPIEFELLSHLVRNAGRVLTRDQLLDWVWGPGYQSPDAVKWHISRLRQKLGDDPENPQLIQTVRGVGYRYQKPGWARETSPH